MKDIRNHFRVCVALVPAAIFLVAGTLWSGQAVDDVAAQRVLDDIKLLASDELEGRGVGTRGIDRAADYIRDQFRQAGLKSVLPDGGYFQGFETPNGGELIEPNQLAVKAADGTTTRWAMGKDFMPLAIGGAGRFDAPLVFAGYGITVPTSAQGAAPVQAYDDFENLDVKGKVVIVLDRGPGQPADPKASADPHSAIGSRQMTLRQKVSNAASHGAAAMLFVRAAAAESQDAGKLMEFGERAELRTAKIPVAQITSAAADAQMRPALGMTVAAIQSNIDSDMKPRSTALTGVSCTGEINVVQRMAKVKNVIGALEGAGSHADETIVIGAHYDHLGYGEEGSMAPGTKEIHNGADDNASGTAGLMELARRLAKREQKLPRRVLFVAFTAEERGLIGSDYYVKNPAVPLENTIAMINLDMIGRLRNEKLIVEGVGTAEPFRPLVESLGTRYGFNLKPVANGMGPSDQTSFCLKKIPVLFFWTDYHPEYHKPSDDWDKISSSGIDRIVSVVEESVAAVAAMESRPAFLDVAMPAAPSGAASGERAYLGTIPAFGEEVDGVLLSGVTAKAPADVAGIRGGDVLVQIGEVAIHNLQDMQTALESHRPGDRIKITVQRGTLRITFPVLLGRRAAN
jgi:hypothetical protein